MASTFVIVESPAKAKTIGKLLGKKYIVEASMGHVRDLPKSQFGVDIEKNFLPKYITIRGKGQIIDNLKKQAKKSDKVLLATDPDREGEAISWHLANLLGVDEDKPCRIEFHEITKNAILDSLKHPRAINKSLVDSQQARRVLDRLVGYQISPILWRKIKWGLSAGRVQSVVVKLICDRENEILSFVPEEYWSITAKLNKANSRENFEARFHGDEKGKIQINNKEECENIIKGIKNGQFVVKKVKKSEKKRYPSPPFTTSSLQQEAYKNLGYSTKRTMMIAQQLYEGIEIKGHGTIGLITYMRTDSTKISDEAQSQAREIIEKEYGKKYMPETPKQYKSKKGAQEAHEAIRPTYSTIHPDSIKGSLKDEQYKLYKLIWNRFISSQMSEAVMDTVAVDIENNGYIFKANGSKVKFQGFMAVYAVADEEDEENTNIPELTENETLKLKKLEDKQHFTQPPPRYTEATLVKTLEENGIGRPSTYAPIISTVIDRNYVEREKKNLRPTELGRVVNDIMSQYFTRVVNVEFTADMERQLDDIEEGEKEWVHVVEEFYDSFAPELKQAEEEIDKIMIVEEPEVTDIKCEKCGRFMVIKKGRFGKFLACPGYPECKHTKPLLEELDVSCPRCGGNIIVRRTKKGRKFYGCKNYPACNFMSWDEPAKEKCPKCGSMMVKNFAKGKGARLICLDENCKNEIPLESAKTDEESNDL
ncbi:DNA topoisomerase 1 [Oxobacter pfennigii]|uniref:DNA topoisomerase 1 n=1 Tax=Oxobacter pfennigii TaxID=36849 RepID=A0A0P8W846_9CLOT|nr:type I DNA topoisomerase [Oxobacter pfennigii]KPU43922.1 DNA topoisomerase 1 [Oxobacter pfennigii]